MRFAALQIAHIQGDFDRWEADGPDLLATLQSQPGSAGHPSSMETGLHLGLIESAIQREDHELALQRSQAGIADARKRLQAAPDDADAKRALVRILGNQSVALIEAQSYGAAEEAIREGLALAAELKGSSDLLRMEASHWNNLGGIERARNRYAAAESAERKALARQAAALHSFPESEQLYFEVGRSYYRIALSMRLAGRPDAALRKELRASLPLLQRSCQEGRGTWDQHRLLATVASELAELEVRQKQHKAAYAAFRMTSQALDATRALRPLDEDHEAFRREAWKRTTGYALHYEPEQSLRWLEEYETALGGHPEGERNLASMLCVLAGRVQAGKSPLPKPRFGDREEYRDYLLGRAIEALGRAAKANGLSLEKLNTHPAWKVLHGRPGFETLRSELRSSPR